MRGASLRLPALDKQTEKTQTPLHEGAKDVRRDGRNAQEQVIRRQDGEQGVSTLSGPS
jgi:hypothetical protein